MFISDVLCNHLDGVESWLFCFVSLPGARGSSPAALCYVLEKSLLFTGPTQEDQSQHDRKHVDWDVKNQIKQNTFTHILHYKYNVQNCLIARIRCLKLPNRRVVGTEKITFRH